MNQFQAFCGRDFEEGFQDCFTLAQEFFAPAGITIRNYARPSRWYLVPDFDFFTTLFAREGFVSVSKNSNDIRIGDVLLMTLGQSAVVNHVAIYVGRGQILHHLTGQKSRLDSYSPKWRVRVSEVIRHPSWETYFEGIRAEDLANLPFAERQRIANKES